MLAGSARSQGSMRSGMKLPLPVLSAAACQWTYNTQHLHLIDWTITTRQCKCRQNKLCCYTQLTQQLANTQISLLKLQDAKPAPALPPVRLQGWQAHLSDFLTGKSEWINSGNSHIITRIAPCWISTLFGFIHTVVSEFILICTTASFFMCIEIKWWRKELWEGGEYYGGGLIYKEPG